jgi:hypothetical protein
MTKKATTSDRLSLVVLSRAEYDVREELKKARAAFPSNKQLLHAFVEEAGEVTKAFLDMQQKKGDSAQTRKELIQAAAMAMRLLEEGDPEFPEFTP